MASFTPQKSGHGKAVISSYMIANGETWRRGVAICPFVSAMLQATVAVVLVAIAAGLIGVTAKAMGETVRWIEIASYSLIALVGLQLVWNKGRSLVRAWSASGHEHQHTEDHDHGPDYRDLLKDHHRHDGCSHRHRHAATTTDAQAQAHAHHDHEDHTGHSHGPTPQELAAPVVGREDFPRSSQ